MLRSEPNSMVEGPDRGPDFSGCGSCPARAISFCGSVHAGLLMRHRRDLDLRHRQRITFDTSNALFNVVSGFVKLTRTMADGRTQILGFRGAGEFLLVRDEQPAMLELEAIGPARLCRFFWPQLKRLLLDHPAALAQLLSKIQDQLEMSHDHTFLLGRKTAQEKVASFILQYGAARAGRAPRRPGGKLRVTRTEMADYLGLTIETVSRVLARLAREDIVAFGRAYSIHVLDAERLRLAAGT
jgi:CRP/FNR family transcriptional regulator